MCCQNIFHSRFSELLSWHQKKLSVGICMFRWRLGIRRTWECVLDTETNWLVIHHTRHWVDSLWPLSTRTYRWKLHYHSKMKTFSSFIFIFNFFYCFFFFLHFHSRKQSLIWITQTNYKIFKLISSQRPSILGFTAVAMVHINVLKLMMTQIAVLLITDVDNFSAFCRAIMLIALAIMFVSMQS